MEEDSVFTKRFVDCLKKHHEEREEKDVDFICHTLKKLSEFRSYDSASLRKVPERLVYESYQRDSILYSEGDKASCWYYVLSGSVLISMNYFFYTGSSFGQCITSETREDQCLILESTELLRINYTEEELRRIIRVASRSQLSLSSSSGTSIDRSGGSSTHGEPSRQELISQANHRRDAGMAGSRPIPMANPKVMAALAGSCPLAGEGMFMAAALDLHQSTFPQPNTPVRAPSGVPLRKAHKLSVGDREDAVDIDMIDPLESEPLPLRSKPQGRDSLERNRRSRSEERVFTFDSDDVKRMNVSMSNDSLNKAMDDPVRPFDEVPTSTEVRIPRRLRDRERRYSAPLSSDRKSATSIRDSVGSIDYLSESQVDSDDEESVQSESSNSPSMDAVLEVLSKKPSERCEEDIERVMDVLQYMPIFSNMTSNIRRALFQVLMLYSLETENTVVIDNGEEVSKWYVVLNGQLRLQRETEMDKMFHVGDSFGVTASLKILPHRGKLVTAVKDCTLCYVSSDEYGRILTQGEEDLKKIEEDGQLVAVLEKRAVDRREGFFVIQATPEKLLEILLMETVDDTFHQDFLLTYRTFLDTPHPITEKLRTSWNIGTPEQRERITMIVLNWVTEHFADFEGNTDMIAFLDWFESSLLDDGKVGEKRALDKARSVHAKLRFIEMDRAGTNSPLDFNVVGGWEVAHPIFVSKIEPNSIPERAGLRVGDQILEINDNKCDKKELREVYSILKKNFKLSLKVRSNIPEYKQFMADPPKPPPDYNSPKSRSPGPLPLAARMPIARTNSEEAGASLVDGPHRGRSYSHVPHRNAIGSASVKTKKRGSVPKMLKPLTGVGKSQFEKLKRRIRGNNYISSDMSDGSSGPMKAKAKMSTRKSSENLLDDKPFSPPAPVRASSLEDIHTYSTGGGGASAARIVDAVVKLYVPDHCHKYIDISPSTTVAELISRGVKEFYPEKFVVSPSDEFCVCMVTVTSRNGPIRNSVLPNHMTDLANFIGLESRYYLKERAFHGTLVQDEEAEQIFKESRQWEHILNLSPKQVAEELTRQDSEVFCSVDTSEYIADLWRNPDHLTKEHLEKFENIPNDEMYWVVTTVISETRSEVRAKLIKHFIKVAKWCKELRNYNSMFHLLSGLSHGLVQRLRSTWEKVPGKWRRLMEDLNGYLNPFHNMAKYRELQRNTAVPLIPFFPIIKKDLTFLFDGNETQVDGLVNFEKLRMLSRQIRVIKTYCQQPMMPEPPQIDLGQLGVLKSIHHSIRMRNRGATALATLTDNALKKIYHHHRMSKMVRKHLGRKYVVQEETLLEKIADNTDKMAQYRRNPPSPLRGKKAAQKEKHKSANMTMSVSSISPSPTTGSLGSDSSAHAGDSTNTPPLSPRKVASSAAPVSGLACSLQQDSLNSTSTPPKSPSSLNSYGNGSAQCPK